MSNLNNPPAFPTPVPDDILNKQGHNITVLAGMTLRDYFAGKALQGIMTDWRNTPAKYTVEILAKEMYEIADAMLAERAKKEAE